MAFLRAAVQASVSILEVSRSAPRSHGEGGCIEMSVRERDWLKVLHGVVQGERRQKEAARRVIRPVVQRTGEVPLL